VIFRRIEAVDYNPRVFEENFRRIIEQIVEMKLNGNLYLPNLSNMDSVRRYSVINGIIYKPNFTNSYILDPVYDRSSESYLDLLRSDTGEIIPISRIALKTRKSILTEPSRVYFASIDGSGFE